MSHKDPARWLGWCYALTILTSAFLLFQVQPVMSKAILPWFGGSPAVWTVCMLFFQVVLFGGYAYAHWTTGRLSPAWQGGVHLALIVAALCLLPITPQPTWKPADSGQPTWRILLLLGAHVGLPYFLLSTTGPLVQAWYSRACRGRSPYRLYALSNAGSLVALLSYPFLVEPALTTRAQGDFWSLGFCVFALLCGYCAIRLWRDGKSLSAGVDRVKVADETVGEGPPSTATRAVWLLLPAFASVMLLATTNHVCQDVAVIPFLWVVPLSLYLLSFIICFDNEAWYRGRWYGLGTALSVFVISAMMIAGLYNNLVLEIAIHFTVLFFICMVCHGELARRKPSPRYLTSFYLMCSGGGALGGVFVALVCPLVFSSYFELNLGLLAAFGLSAAVLAVDARRTWLVDRPRWRLAGGFIVFVALLAVVKAQFGVVIPGKLAISRNFYGVLYVRQTAGNEPERHGRLLVHGRVVHGYQYLAPHKRRLATKYYNRDSGVGVTLRRLAGDGPLRVGAVGLGVGTIAAYGKKGDYYRFYEINPDVLTLAKDYFTFLDDSPARVEVVLGDARLSMERESPQQFDVLVLDAFSGDAIPTHLLTREAFNVYRRHLSPQGVVATNISNRHVNLVPVLARLAEHQRLRLVEIRSPGTDEPGSSPAHWVLLTRNEAFLRDEVVRAAVHSERGQYVDIPIWTDEYSNLFQILK